MAKLLAPLALVCLAAPLAAQQVTRHELALGAEGTGVTPFGGIYLPGYTAGGRGLLLSPQLRYTFNLNRNIAVETSLSDSVDKEPINLREGGKQLLALGGLKAGIRRGRWGFFGTSSAGVASFSRGQAITYFSTGQTIYEHVTHFALRQGFAAEYTLTPRTFVRVDAAELLDAQFRRIFNSDPTFIIGSYGNVPYHGQLTASVAHRFGKLQDLPSQPDTRETRGYSVGGAFILDMQEHLLNYELRADGGGGAWVGFPLGPRKLSRFLSADLLAYDQPHDDHTASFQDGGTTYRPGTLPGR